MIAATTIWTVFDTIAIFGGIGLLIAIIGLVVLICIREADDRPLLPWGARMRVEKAKAHTEIIQESLNQDAAEIKRLAIAHHRDRIIQAIKDEDHEQVQALGLPSGRNSNY